MYRKEFIVELDAKGRVTIPKEILDEYGLKPKDRIKLKVSEPRPRLSFMKECKGALKGAGDAVKILHEESPFR